MRTPEDDWHVVRYADAVGLGIQDGRAVIIGPRGCMIRFDTSAFRDADELIHLLDTRVDHAVRFTLGDDL